MIRGDESARVIAGAIGGVERLGDGAFVPARERRWGRDARDGGPHQQETACRKGGGPAPAATPREIKEPKESDASEDREWHQHILHVAVREEDLRGHEDSQCRGEQEGDYPGARVGTGA